MTVYVRTVDVCEALDDAQFELTNVIVWPGVAGTSVWMVSVVKVKVGDGVTKSEIVASVVTVAVDMVGRYVLEYALKH